MNMIQYIYFTDLEDTNMYGGYTSLYIQSFVLMIRADFLLFQLCLPIHDCSSYLLLYFPLPLLGAD